MLLAMLTSLLRGAAGTKRCESTSGGSVGAWPRGNSEMVTWIAGGGAQRWKVRRTPPPAVQITDPVKRQDTDTGAFPRRLQARVQKSSQQIVAGERRQALQAPRLRPPMQFLTQQRQDDTKLTLTHAHVSPTAPCSSSASWEGAGACKSHFNCSRQGEAAAGAAFTLTQQVKLQQGMLQEAQGAVGQPEQASRMTWLHAEVSSNSENALVLVMRRRSGSQHSAPQMRWRMMR